MTQDVLAARIRGLNHHYGKTRALDQIDFDVPAGQMIGLIGPDGVGKSTLLSILAGARAIQQGQVEVLGGDMAVRSHRKQTCPRIAYVPQGLGKNLYPTLSVEENLQFFARLFGHDAAERRRRIDDLTVNTGLHPFLSRPAGKLSGGMKQKLGLCCALIHDPDFLILDEPTTGVDPLARSQFWDLIARIRADHSGRAIGSAPRQSVAMSVIVATAYMDEALRFDRLAAMDEGHILATGTPTELLQVTGQASLEASFIHLLPTARREGYTPVEIPPLPENGEEDIAIEARDLTMRFGDFVAVDHVSLRIRRGEIFGFLGSNGCGKSTTMKVLTGLLPASEGRAWLFGHEIDSDDLDVRRRVGYMSQYFSLYGELTVRQNLFLHAHLFRVAPECIDERVRTMVERFGLGEALDTLPGSLPLGIRQRLSLAVAMVHEPELLILDEPTSGVDPIARDEFWRLLITLSRRDRVTIFISTHFMNEAERCDRMSMMHAGRVLDSDRPAELVRKRGARSLEEAFIGYLLEATGNAPAVLDRDQSTISHAYALNLSGSRYFVEHPPIIDDSDMDRRMRSGELSLAIEIPPGFGRDLLHDRAPEIGAWIDGAMPQRAETVKGYVQGMHQQWLALQAGKRLSASTVSPVDLQTRFRYNPDVRSLPAMVPVVIPLLLMMLPARLTALAVVREKEIGSIINLYVTPVTRTEFLLGKQIPYIGLALLNFAAMCLLSVMVFGVPIKGSLATLALAGFVYCIASTGLGLLASAMTRSQIAALFFTMLATLIPAVQFSGLLDPVSSMEGVGLLIGRTYPTAHMFTISRGVFNKALQFHDLWPSIRPLMLSIPLILGTAIALLRKQDR